MADHSAAAARSSCDMSETHQGFVSIGPTKAGTSLAALPRKVHPRVRWDIRPIIVGRKEFAAAVSDAGFALCPQSQIKSSLRGVVSGSGVSLGR